VPHLLLDVQALDCDFLAFSGHKMLGPTGIGALYVKPQVLHDLEPFLRGGEMVREVWYDRATWNDIPHRFEAGTPNIADALALGAAVDYLNNLGMENVRQHEMQLTRYALRAFEELDEVKVYGPKDVNIRGGIVSFYSEAVHPHDLGTILDRDGIAIRAGHHCAMPLMRGLGVVATARASFYVYNYEEEIDFLMVSLKKALRYFGDGVRSPR
jgi:cysteine desulfurase/selenocysteine lyase